MDLIVNIGDINFCIPPLPPYNLTCHSRIFHRLQESDSGVIGATCLNGIQLC